MDLSRYFHETSHATHTVRDIKFISKQLCSAMSYLHSCRVVHRDLKPNNVLIDPRTLQVRIADFGLCRSFELPPGTGFADVMPETIPIRKSHSEMNFETFAESQELFGEDDSQDQMLLDSMCRFVLLSHYRPCCFVSAF